MTDLVQINRQQKKQELASRKLFDQWMKKNSGEHTLKNTKLLTEMKPPGQELRPDPKDNYVFAIAVFDLQQFLGQSHILANRLPAVFAHTC